MCNENKILTDNQAREKKIRVQTWKDYGFDASEKYALSTDPTSPLSSLIDYYDTLDLAYAAQCEHNSANGRPIIYVNEKQ